MSYILAALKKADEEHFLGSVPDLATPQEIQPVEARSFQWRWVIIALLAVNAVLVAVLLKDKFAGASKPPIAEQSTTAVQPPLAELTPVAEPVTDLPAQQPPASEEQASQAAPATADTAINAASAPAWTTTPVKEKPARSGGEVVVLPEPAQPYTIEASILPDEDPGMSGGVTATAPDASQLQSWFDLPQEVRNNLDLPRLDVHVYSEDPAGRFILVNLKKYREGETLPNGMVLEEILPDGMIMSYRGQRFRVDK